MIRKERLVVGVVVFLFFGLAFITSINAVEFKSLNVPPFYGGNLSGYVYNTNMDPIEGALVRVYFHETYEEDYSNENGYYHVSNIPICYCMKNCTCSKQCHSTEWILMGITGNTNYDFILTQIAPMPDLDCEGELDFVDVIPGSTVTGTITVENVGEIDSLLNWEVESWPEWGTWTFDPEYGFDLLEGDTITLDVEIVAPLDPLTEFEGEVVIVNSDEPLDFCTVGISLPTRNADMFSILGYYRDSVPVFNQLFEFLENHFPLLYQMLAKLF